MNQISFSVTRCLGRLAAVASLCAASLGLLHPALAQTTTQQQPTVPTFQTAPAQPAAGGQQQQLPLVIGILDTQKVLNESSVGKSLNAQWAASIKALTDDLDKKEGQLRLQAQQLEQQRVGNPPLSPADYEAKRNAIQAQDNQLQQAFNKGRQGLEQRRDKALQTVTNAARKAMAEAAKAHNMTLIIDRSAAPYIPETWNITDEVIARLNKALPNVKL